MRIARWSRSPTTQARTTWRCSRRFKSPAFYVGRARIEKPNNDKRRKRLGDFDLSADEIARLHGPVGLKIGSRTPPEIAVAILAEMTAVRRGVQIPQTIEPPKAGVEAGCSVPQN